MTVKRGTGNRAVNWRDSELKEVTCDFYANDMSDPRNITSLINCLYFRETIDVSGYFNKL